MPHSTKIQLRAAALHHRAERLPHWRLKRRDLSRVAALRFEVTIPLMETESEGTAEALIQSASRLLTELELCYPTSEEHASEDEAMREIWEFEPFEMLISRAR